MTIKNIIFDIGGVLVQWQPLAVIEAILPAYDAQELYDKMRATWIALNLGKLTVAEAVSSYEAELGIARLKLEELMLKLRTSQIPIEGSIKLLQKLKDNGYQLYALTDNIKKFLDYHKANSAFWSFFIDIISAHEVGVLKPDPKIFQHFLQKYNLRPEELVFIDDILGNMQRANNLKINGIHFINYESCIEALSNFGVTIN